MTSKLATTRTVDRSDEQPECLADWRLHKPNKRRQPLRWLRRKLMLKLNDLMRPFGLRVTEQVPFSSLRRDISAAHIIDVGVATGTPTLYERFPAASLELFEPAKSYGEAIDKNILSKRAARLHRVALSDRDGFGVLVRPGSSGATLQPALPYGSADPNCEAVPVRRLDSVLSTQDLRRPCLLKIDTEGTELAVLKGASGIIDSIDTIVVEVHFRRSDTYRPDELMSFLSDEGFVLTDMLEREVIQGCVACCDFVFWRRSSV